MRLFAVLFVALLSVPALACNELPAGMNFKNLKGEFKTFTGDFTVNIAFVDLARSECARDSRTSETYRIENAATVSVTNNATKEVVQKYTTSLSFFGQNFFLMKPYNMVNGGIEIDITPRNQVVIFLDGAAIKPEVIF